MSTKRSPAGVQPVAIVGISAELPSGTFAQKNFGHNTFFDFLLSKGEAYEEIPSDRFNVQAWAGHALGQVSATQGSFLKDVGMFDHMEFGVSLKDARAMALSSRKLIELSFLSLLDAGIDYRGRNVGCYASGTAFDILSIAEPDELEARGSFAGIPCMIANKISYHLDLKGPSIPVDTACSSSLTALHLAVQALRTGECESAVVGGCQLNLRLADFVQYSQGSVLARDGKCKPFDIEADGFSRGEGAVAIVVKLYDDAVRDGDHIYASILGTAVNASGSSAPPYAPVADAQAAAMHNAYQGTGRDPKEVDYVEMHATGTAAGDPAECNWVGEHFGREAELLIGSVKGNIGHLEIAAFLASLSKVCSIFERRLIPPNVNLKCPNPAIKWAEYRLRVPLESTPIIPRSSSGKFLISMSSSGIGGANGHIVVESEPPRPARQDANGFSGRPALLVAGGLSPRSSSAVADALGHLVNAYPDQRQALSTIYGRRARHMTWRSFIVAHHSHQASPLRFPAPVLSPRIRPPIVFLFSGQGPQHIEMGRQLFKRFPIFRDSIVELDRCHREVSGISLMEQTGLFADGEPMQKLPGVWPISVVLPSLAMVQMAMFDLLVSFGLRPDIVIGHSAGETALLYASGAGSKSMAMEIAIARGKAMTLLEQLDGTMAALACSPDQAESIIHSALQGAATGGVLEIACLNAPRAVAIAGDTLLVEKAVAIAISHGIFARKILTRVPVHSSLMEICRRDYCSLVSNVFARHPGIHEPWVATYSTCTGERLRCFSDEYFWRNSRHPVQFTHTIGSILRMHPSASFVEISPHSVLSTYLHELGVSAPSAVCPMRRTKDIDPHHEETVLLTALGQLVILGHNVVDFGTLNCQERLDDGLELPPYPFVKKHVPYLPDHSPIIRKQMGAWNGPLNSADLRINKLTHPELAQHIVNGEPIMPAAGFLEMALESGAKLLWNVQFHSILSLSPEVPVQVDVEVDRMYWCVKTRGLTTGFPKHDSETTRMHADGYMSRDILEGEEFGHIEIAAIQSRCERLNPRDFYEALQYFAQYGPVFRRTLEFYLGSNESLVKIRGADPDLPSLKKYIIHPAILDACIHVVVHPNFTANPDRNVYYLLSRLDAFVAHGGLSPQGPFPNIVYAHVVLKEWLPEDPDRLDGTSDQHSMPDSFRDAQQLAISTAVTSVVDDLVDICRAILNHIVQVSQKKTIRILELEYGSGTLSERLCVLFQDLSGFHINYYVGTKDLDTLSLKDLPRFCRPIELNLSDPLNAQGLSEASFDVIIGLGAFTLRDSPYRDLQNLSTLLVLGGILLLAEPCAEKNPLHHAGHCLNMRSNNFGHDLEGSPQVNMPIQWQPLLSSLGFRTAARHSKAPGPGFLLLEGQHPSLSLTLMPLTSTLPDVVIVPYMIGREMDAQRAVKAIDIDRTVCLWFTATAGIDADAARGFTRSLRREFPLWSVGLAIFESVWPIPEQTRIVCYLSTTPGMEPEVVISNQYEVLVPRFCETSQPSSSLDLIPLPTDIPPSHVQVAITATSISDAGIYGLVGHISGIGDDSDSSLLGCRIVTITTDTPGRHLSIHKASVSLLDLDIEPQLMASIVPSLIIGGLALGLGFLQNPSRGHSGRIIVTHKDTVLGQGLLWFFSTLGLHPLAVASSASPLQISSLQLRFNDIVVTGYDEDDQILSSCLVEDSRVFYWTSIKVAHMLARDPWIIGDTLQVAISKVRGTQFPGAAHICNEPCLLPSLVSSALFRSDKTYLLIGGIRSLGLHICVWMYEKGARHVIVTSRSGRQSLERAHDVLALRMLGYLETRDDLSLRLEASDALSLESTNKMLNGIKRPIAGCMLLSGVLSDRSFFSQDDQSFEIVFAPKLRAFENLEATLDIKKLDFLITFSSIATFGNVGQTNYASANTALDGKIGKYDNAFSLVSPAITDTISIVGRPDRNYQVSQFQHLLPWAFSARELCACIEDGILKLATEPYNLYIPDLDWAVVQKYLGPSELYNHLVESSAPVRSTQSPDSETIRDVLRDTVLQFLDIDPDEFLPDVPFTSYGIDSLSAGRLSFALRPFLAISQIQLLGDISLDDVEHHIKQERETQAAVKTSATDDVFKWEEVNRVGQTLVKLIDFGGVPLILVHGASGSIVSFMPLQQAFTTSLWALQTTPETPMDSITAMAQFYYSKIKAAQPEGPYRIGGYSGTSLLVFVLVQLMQSHGDRIVQLVILDHFPLLFASLYLAPDEDTIRRRSPGPAMIRRVLDSMLVLYRADSSSLRHRFANDFEDAANGLQVPPYMHDWFSTFSRIVVITYEFMFQLQSPHQPYSLSSMQQALTKWMQSVQAPVTTCMASRGVLASIPATERSNWKDAGTHQVFPDAEVTSIEGSHFEILESSSLVELLQTGWTAGQ